MDALESAVRRIAGEGFPPDAVQVVVQLLHDQGFEGNSLHHTIATLNPEKVLTQY